MTDQEIQQNLCRRIFASVEQRVEAYACSDGVQESEIRRKCLVSSTARMIAKVRTAARRCLRELDDPAVPRTRPLTVAQACVHYSLTLQRAVDVAQRMCGSTASRG